MGQEENKSKENIMEIEMVKIIVDGVCIICFMVLIGLIAYWMLHES